MKEIRLSTADNPYNPFTNWDEWYLFDNDHGYDSCGLLARMAHVSDSLTKQEYNEEIERAVDDILKYDMTNNYIKVVREVPNESENEVTVESNE